MVLHAAPLLQTMAVSLQDTCRIAWQSAQPATSCIIHSNTAEKACASCAALLSCADLLLPGV
jgi:hypothetical protein